MVYISNIPYDVRWMEIKDLCREKAGEVSYVEMLETPDHKSKGCAVVEFKETDAAKKCVEAMHRMQMKDRYIVAKEIRLPYNVQSGKIYEVFGVAGKVVMVDLQLDKEGKSKGLSVVEYTHPIEAVQAVSMLNNQRLYDRSITVKMDKYEKQADLRRPGELPVGLKGVGMGLGTNGQPLTNVDQLINALPVAQPAPQPLMGGAGGPGNMGNILSAAGFGAAGGHAGAGGGAYGNLGGALNASLGGPTQPQGGMGGAYGAGGGAYGGGVQGMGGGFDASSLQNAGGYGGGGGVVGGGVGAPRSLMGADPYGGVTGGGGDGRMGGGYDSAPPRRDYDAQGRLSPLGARRSSRSIIIQNLPADYTWQMVRDRLRGFGDIEFADIVQPGIAKVRFKTGMEAERAVSGLNGMSVEGRPITVDFGYND